MLRLFEVAATREQKEQPEHSLAGVLYVFILYLFFFLLLLPVCVLIDITVVCLPPPTAASVRFFAARVPAAVVQVSAMSCRYAHPATQHLRTSLIAFFNSPALPAHPPSPPLPRSPTQKKKIDIRSSVAKQVLLKGFACPQKKCGTSHCLCVKKGKKKIKIEQKSQETNDEKQKSLQVRKSRAGSIALQKCATPALFASKRRDQHNADDLSPFFFFLKNKQTKRIGNML